MVLNFPLFLHHFWIPLSFLYFSEYSIILKECYPKRNRKTSEEVEEEEQQEEGEECNNNNDDNDEDWLQPTVQRL